MCEDRRAINKEPGPRADHTPDEPVWRDCINHQQREQT